MIDHQVNHHPELGSEDYEKIQTILDDYDDIKDLSGNGKTKIAFIKKLGKGYAVVAELSEDKGKIMLHKTFFYKDSEGKRIPYKNKRSLLEKWSVDGSTTIIPTVKQQPADTENISALDHSTGKDKSINSNSQDGVEEISRKLDRDYLDAVERVATDTVEKMVRDAAAKAMPNTKVVDGEGKNYHDPIPQNDENPLRFASGNSGYAKRELKYDKKGDAFALISGKFIPLQKENAVFVEEAKDTMAKGKPWRDDFPIAIQQTSVQALKNDADYLAAKSGDIEAAIRLVKRLAKEDKIKAIVSTYPNAIVTYGHAQEATGTNKIPSAYAGLLKSYGLEVNDGIVQMNKPRHTGADNEGKLFRRARFGGVIEEGRDYILVDDILSSGATLRDLKDYIESKGGNVVFITGMASTYGGTKFAQSEAVKNKLKTLNINDEELQKIGIADSVGCLTNAEAERLVSMVNGRGVSSIEERPEGSSRTERQDVWDKEVNGPIPHDGDSPRFASGNIEQRFPRFRVVDEQTDSEDKVTLKDEVVRAKGEMDVLMKDYLHGIAGCVKIQINHNRPSPRLVALMVAVSKLRSSAPSEHFRLHGVNHNVPPPTAVAKAG